MQLLYIKQLEFFNLSVDDYEINVHMKLTTFKISRRGDVLS